MNTDYDLDYVRAVLEGCDLKENTRIRYLVTWRRWLQWCEEQGLQPSTARRADVDRFIAEIPLQSQRVVRHHISSIYHKVRGEQDNPAILLRPMTLFGKNLQQSCWDKWAYWCGRFSAEPLPADPNRLASYLEEVCRKKSLSTARRALNAISRTHVESDLPDLKRAEPVIQIMEALQLSLPNANCHHAGGPPFRRLSGPLCRRH